MNYKKIEKYSLISLGIICLCLLIFGYKYSLGFLLGGLTSLFNLKVIEKLEDVELVNYKSLKSDLRKNHLIRSFMYALVLLASFLRPNVFSFITCMIGLLLTKVWIVIIESKELKEG